MQQTEKPVALTIIVGGLFNFVLTVLWHEESPLCPCVNIRATPTNQKL